MARTVTQSPNLKLAGLAPRDLVSGRHPYLHLAALDSPVHLEPATPREQAVLRRQRTARFTPGGLEQPPEVMGVTADARVPNALQPMSGEFQGDAAGGGHEVADGRPAFFDAMMPPPTGVANGVGVGADLAQPRSGGARVFGAPTGMPTTKPASGFPRLSGEQLLRLAALSQTQAIRGR